MLDPKTGMSQGHTWTRGHERAPPLPETLEVNGQILCHPRELGTHYQDEWARLWTQKTSQEYQEVVAAIREVRRMAGYHENSSQQLALKEEWPKITGADVKKGLKEIANNTALGIDQWGPKLLKLLPDDALEELAEVLNNIEQAMAWPSHTLYNIIVLMGKPGGGTRLIALMPMIYRIWTKIRKPFL